MTAFVPLASCRVAHCARALPPRPAPSSGRFRRGALAAGAGAAGGLRAVASMALGAHQLSFTKSADEIRRGLKELTESYELRIQKILEAATAGDSSFGASFGRLAEADGRAALLSAELTLPALVSGDAAERQASQEAKKALQQMWSKTYARPELYEVLAAQTTAKTAEEVRLASLLLAKFRQSGAQLGPAARAAFARLEAQSSSLASQAEQNINEDCSFVDLAPEDLEGCSESFVQSLPTEAGLKRCSLKAPVLAPIMQRAVRSETRRRMMEASQQRCMDTNGPILEELVTARHNAAVQLGFKSHAERVLSAKMAATPAAVESFCREMLQRMRAARDQDLRRLAQRKQKDSEPGQKRKAEGELHAWDVSYYSDLLKREELSLDDEKLKEFFPLEGTIQRMLQVYSELLGLGFERSELPTWHQEVLAFEVKDGSKVVGHLYLDQFPRDGKFSHQMIVPLSPAFVSESGEECLPACVNISNLSRPEGSRPALLRFAEMKTLFHELGHVVHCLCTQSRFSLLSWAWPMVPWPGGVEQDFLEVPSMALEKFACEPQLLQRVASHFEDPQAQLEESTIQTIKDLERWMVGIQESRYFAMSLFDLMVHSQAPPYSLDGEEGLSLAELFRRVMQQQTCLQQLPDTNFSCSW
ncbi:unnamed protein product, partial [Effrenium voratum]